MYEYGLWNPLAGYRPPVRDGEPLPGTSPGQVVSQLAHRVFGPLHRDRVRTVLDYHGLAGQVAGTLAEVAARHGVSTTTVSLRMKAVRTAGSKLPLTPVLIAEVTRRSTPTEDHLARVRIARTLALTAPRRPPPADHATGPSTSQAPAHTALRILAAVGPLDTETLLAAVGRARRFRDRTPFSATDFEAGLRQIGPAQSPDGRWHTPVGTDAPNRYRAIVAAAGGRDVTRGEMIQVLIDAGYSRNSAIGRMSSSHPLFHRVGRNCYRVVGTLPR